MSESESRAGVPWPCPNCGGYVAPHYRNQKWRVTCDTWAICDNDGCYYSTEEYPLLDDAWREHERNCQAEEDER